jgi:hypothetical protein
MIKRNMIITAILVMAVLTAGTSIFLLNQSNAVQITNTITQQGTKIDFQNNNTQAWTHIDLVIPNATSKNGTTTTYYSEVWIKPGENKTIDLSDLLGYGSTPLPPGTTIKLETWSGLFNPNNTGTSNLNVTIKGWSNTTTPVTAPSYNLTNLNMPIGPLPSSITNTTAPIATDTASIETPGENDNFASFFTEEIITVNSNGDLTVTFTTPGGLSQTIARLI